MHRKIKEEEEEEKESKQWNQECRPSLIRVCLLKGKHISSSEYNFFLTPRPVGNFEKSKLVIKLFLSSFLGTLAIWLQIK